MTLCYPTPPLLDVDPFRATFRGTPSVTTVIVVHPPHHERHHHDTTDGDDEGGSADDMGRHEDGCDGENWDATGDQRHVVGSSRTTMVFVIGRAARGVVLFDVIVIHCAPLNTW